MDAPHTEDPIEANRTVDFYAILYGDVTGNWVPAGKSMTIGGELSAEDKIAKADAARAVELAAIVKPSSPSYRSLDVAFEISHVLTTGISRGLWERVFLLEADDIDDVIGIDITLFFDSDEVEITDIEKESLVSGFALVENGAIKDQYYVGLYTAIAPTGDGEVLTITLEHESLFNPGAGVPFSVELAANEEDIDVD